jgi:DNA recombination protein RmuC
MLFQILIILLLIVGFVFLYLAMKSMMNTQKDSQLEAVVDKVFGMSVQKVTQQSREILRSDKEAIHFDLENKQKVMEKLVAQLKDEMNVHQKEIRKAENDRIREFTAIVESLEQHKSLASELKVSTDSLAQVLSNNQKRGAWGERIIEDLMISNGLVEGVHFVKQQQLGDSNLRPDIMLLLPNKRVVPIDVKFPYSEMQKMSLAESKTEQKVHLKQFELDLKIKIEKVAQYIDVGRDTLDYAIMFVPNEALFSFINQNLPGLVDLAISKRVLMVSPFTFLIVARTVMESYRNFMIGDKLKEVVKYIDDFVVEWGKFKGSFEKYGSSLLTLQKDYDNLSGTRVRVMEKKIGKVQSYSSGNLISKVSEIEKEN